MYRNTVTQSNEVVKVGYLTKSPPGDAPPMSQWRRRWFVLRDSLRSYPLAERFVRLEYYQNESEARKLADPKGVIDLTNCTRVSGSAPIKGHKYVLDLCTKDRRYHLAADTPTEKHDWMEILNELLFSSEKNAKIPEIQTQDLEGAEFERRRSQSRPAVRQTSLDTLKSIQRPSSYYEGLKENFVLDQRSERRDFPFEVYTGPKPFPRKFLSNDHQKRPLPPTPDQEQPHPVSPPIPKPRLKLETRISSQNGTSTSPTKICPFNLESNYEFATNKTSTQQNNPQQPSDYEVPISALSNRPSPPITQGRNATSAPILTRPGNYEIMPPIPIPRTKRVVRKEPSLKRSDSLCGSLPDINTDYAMLEPAMNLSQNEDEDDTYGQLLRIGPIRERRFSDPEIIPLSPHSPSPSSFSNVIFFDSSPTGSANERESPKSRYYENTNIVPLLPRKEEPYCRLSYCN